MFRFTLCFFLFIIEVFQNTEIPQNIKHAIHRRLKRRLNSSFPMLNKAHQSAAKISACEIFRTVFHLFPLFYMSFDSYVTIDLLICIVLLKTHIMSHLKDFDNNICKFRKTYSSYINNENRLKKLHILRV